MTDPEEFKEQGEAEIMAGFLKARRMCAALTEVLRTAFGDDEAEVTLDPADGGVCEGWRVGVRIPSRNADQSSLIEFPLPDDAWEVFEEVFVIMSRFISREKIIPALKAL